MSKILVLGQSSSAKFAWMMRIAGFDRDVHLVSPNPSKTLEFIREQRFVCCGSGFGIIPVLRQDLESFERPNNYAHICGIDGAAEGLRGFRETPIKGGLYVPGTLLVEGGCMEAMPNVQQRVIYDGQDENLAGPVEMVHHVRVDPYTQVITVTNRTEKWSRKYEHVLGKGIVAHS